MHHSASMWLGSAPDILAARSTTFLPATRVRGRAFFWGLLDTLAQGQLGPEVSHRGTQGALGQAQGLVDDFGPALDVAALLLDDGLADQRPVIVRRQVDASRAATTPPVPGRPCDTAGRPGDRKPATPRGARCSSTSITVQRPPPCARRPPLLRALQQETFPPVRRRPAPAPRGTDPAPASRSAPGRSTALRPSPTSGG